MTILASQAPAQHPTANPGPTGSPRVLVLDPSAIADPVEREQAFVQLLRYQAQVRTSHVRLEEGDRVELLEPVHATWIDPRTGKGPGSTADLGPFVVG
ncbi:hypothetical protein [Kitasatospora sp. NPDC048538]|uniref:hypothetical protein n=1 Tax=unclassified Kitasatospora TaxID=2633591 RepID=UPI00340E2F67